MREHEQLYTTFENSRYGEELASKTRFDVFKPDFVTTEQWGELLGDDVNNLRHMAHTAFIAEMFCAEEDVSTDETNRLLTVASTHDWGEALIGDIPLPDKTDADEKQEKLAYAQIARDLIGLPESAGLTYDVWQVLGHEDEEAGDKFRAIEYLGYSTTALRAGRMATLMANGLYVVEGLTRAQGDQVVSGLAGLEKMVVTNNFPVVKQYAKKYPKAVPTVMKELQ